MRPVIVAVLLVVTFDVAGQICVGFAPPASFRSGTDASRSTVALDANGDGNPDLTITHAPNDAGDFDADGDIDLVVVNQRTDTIAVFLNAGNGTLAPAQVYSARAPGDANPNNIIPVWIVATDLTGDSFLDLAVTTIGRGSIALFIGNDTGSFSPLFPVPSFTLGQPIDVTAADFDEDGETDLAITSLSRLYILLNTHTCAAPIPALSPLALLALSVMIAAAGLLVLRR